MGMKVYIVTQGEYSDYHIEEVFTDREKAEIFCATLNEKYYAFPEIEEYETDKVKIEGKIYRCIIVHGRKYYSYCGDKGEWVYDYLSEEIKRDLNPIKENFSINFNGNYYVIKFIIPVDRYITREEARNIAYDKWNKFKAEQEVL